MSEQTKEQVYDEQISPLMAQIIGICKAHKIATVASFAIPNDDDADLCCTTVLLGTDYNPPAQFLEARDAIYARPTVLAITVTNKEPSQ